MKKSIEYLIAVFVILSIVFSADINSKPKENDGPGCTGDDCHTRKENIINARVFEGLELEVKVNGVSSSKALGYELVDSEGNVVDVIQETRKNPFYLRAEKEGDYIVYAGYQKPEEWDSVHVEIRTIGVNNENKNSSVYLYPIAPNPAKEHIRLRYSLDIYDNGTLTLYDSSGNKLKDYNFEHLCFFKESMLIDVSDFSSGHYYVELSNGKESFTRKLIITK